LRMTCVNELANNNLGAAQLPGFSMVQLWREISCLESSLRRRDHVRNRRRRRIERQGREEKRFS
jgi:hypothetical protein